MRIDGFISHLQIVVDCFAILRRRSFLAISFVSCLLRVVDGGFKGERWMESSKLACGTACVKEGCKVV